MINDGYFILLMVHRWFMSKLHLIQPAFGWLPKSSVVLPQHLPPLKPHKKRRRSQTEQSGKPESLVCSTALIADMISKSVVGTTNYHSDCPKKIILTHHDAWFCRKCVEHHCFAHTKKTHHRTPVATHGSPRSLELRENSSRDSENTGEAAQPFHQPLWTNTHE